ncbi:hypothetical protein Pla175_05060 [Pirellulimonas nuda]|uniref:DUF1499 domain-containing protein n=1 Tax=Pirellulimonas nuda TaxID=2528009 RepID=A0A518D6P4_9BACT|nr:DUF1499 domain-containing protein [Pirellulimonas nuda]QDU87150.1 hypothetical protein Pla175_05060 [Pirellulimonas nuda]
MASKRRIMIYAIGIPLAAVALAALILATHIEDWSRDLTTNRAAATPDARDPRLRPLELEAGPRVLLARIDRLIAESSAWREPEAPKPLPADSPLPALWTGEVVETRHLVHVSGLMRYRDDVWVAIEPAPEGRWRVWAESRSRIGKGDLGQNPRNLRELLSALGDAG